MKRCAFGNHRVWLGGFCLAAIIGCGGKPLDPAPDKVAGEKLRASAGAGGGASAAAASDFGPSGGGWGTLKGRFVFGGTAPAAAALDVNKDQEVCGKHKLVDESLIVDAGGGVKDVVVYLRLPKGVQLPIHPEVESGVKPEIVFDNLHCRFEPHVLPVWLSKQKLIIKNSDAVGHNTNCSITGEDGFNALINPNSQIDYSFRRPQSLPLAAACNVHPWMKGYLLPLEHPYAAVSGADGSFQIANLPTGKWEFQVWQERSAFPKAPGLDRGRFVLEIKEGENNKGDITLPANLFGL